VYEKIVRKKAAKCLILLEAGTGIEPVYTDLQYSTNPQVMFLATFAECARGHPLFILIFGVYVI
jgi:hypothetical protein